MLVRGGLFLAIVTLDLIRACAFLSLYREFV